MKVEKVVVYPDNKKVDAYGHDEEVRLVRRGTVRDTNTSVITDSNGFRYKRKITADDSNLLEYWRI